MIGWCGFLQPPEDRQSDAFTEGIRQQARTTKNIEAFLTARHFWIFSSCSAMISRIYLLSMDKSAAMPTTPPIVRKRDRGRPCKGNKNKKNRGRFGNRSRAGKTHDVCVQTVTNILVSSLLACFIVCMIACLLVGWLHLLSHFTGICCCPRVFCLFLFFVFGFSLFPFSFFCFTFLFYLFCFAS